MNFQLSTSSLKKLRGVDARLVNIVRQAILGSEVDFGVTCGLRTLKEQRELFDLGMTKTLKSKHLIGQAVDLVAYVQGRPCWELPPYFLIAEEVRKQALKENVDIRWGGAWHVPSIAKIKMSMEALNKQYISNKIKKKQKPFVDAPHFEINSS